MSTNQEIIQLGDKYLMNIYAHEEMALAKGEGVYVWDADGNKYLDFLSGIAVTSLGYQHPAVVEAVKNAADTIMHTSNFFWVESANRLAELLVENSCLDKVMFNNSGAEANEAAIKLARKWGKKNKGDKAHHIITMKNSFHGRTMATLSATGQEKIQQGFDPLLPGFTYAEFNNLASVKDLVTDDTVAVMLELVQGEGGVNAADQDFIDGLVEVCEAENLLLIVDEVQTGIGRTGTLFAYEHYGIEPDIITLAKALGNGVPVGAMLAKESVAENFGVGDHGTTFGGNPLATAAGLATVETILAEGFLEEVNENASYFKAELEKLVQEFEFVKAVKGKGYLTGLELSVESKPIYKACLEKGFICNATAGNVLRFLPPLITKKSEIDEGMAILREVFSEYGK